MVLSGTMNLIASLLYEMEIRLLEGLHLRVKGMEVDSICKRNSTGRHGGVTFASVYSWHAQKVWW